MLHIKNAILSISCRDDFAIVALEYCGSVIATGSDDVRNSPCKHDGYDPLNEINLLEGSKNFTENLVSLKICGND